MQDEKLFADGSGKCFIGATTAANVNAKTLNLLIERRERNHETLGSFRLVPSSTFEHVDNDAALDLVHDLEERRIWMIGSGARTRLAGQRRKEFGELQADAADDFFAANIFRKQIDVDALLRRQNDGALDHVFELSHIARPIVIHQELQ